jgi:transcriptional regulator GlxA family with amidase domain
MSAQSKKTAGIEGGSVATARHHATASEFGHLPPVETISLHLASRERLGAMEARLHEGGIGAADLSRERHFSVAELAQLWNLSDKTIRRMFEKEPGVLQWSNEETRFKRGYTTLRIPETVALRVHRRLRIAG